MQIGVLLLVQDLGERELVVLLFFKPEKQKTKDQTDNSKGADEYSVAVDVVVIVDYALY